MEPETADRVIVNPLSGERIVISATGPDGAEPHSAGPGGTVLAWELELELAPGGRVPASHAHPRQEERFTVLEGRIRFRAGWRRDGHDRRRGCLGA